MEDMFSKLENQLAAFTKQASPPAPHAEPHPGTVDGKDGLICGVATIPKEANSSDTTTLEKSGDNPPTIGSQLQSPRILGLILATAREQLLHPGLTAMLRIYSCSL